MANYGAMWWDADIKEWTNVANTSEAAVDSYGHTTRYGPLPVLLSDATNDLVVLPFVRQVGTPTTVAVEPSIGDYDLVVTATTGFIIGDFALIAESLHDRFMLCKILNIVGTTITLDRPIDHEFHVGSFFFEVDLNLASASGAVTPLIYAVRGGVPPSELTLDITRIILRMETLTAPTLVTFGDLAALTRGCLIRVTRADGTVRNLYSFKDNADLSNLAYDLELYADTGPKAVNGLACRFTFSRLGAVVRLNPGDGLEVLIQDDITGITNFNIAAEGHIANER